MGPVVEPTKPTVLGSALRTKEALRHVTGKGSFVDDVKLPNLCFAAILRSPYAHARIKRVDPSRALELPGIIGVLTSDDVVRMSDPLPQMTVPPAANVKDYPIAVGKVRYVGEPVAVVIGETRYVVEDALEHIEVDYEPLPAVVDGRAALEPGAPILHDEVGSNIMAHITYRWGSLEEAIEQADRVLSFKLHFHRFSSVPLEPNAVVASFDPKDATLTVWCNNQEPAFLLPQFNSALRLPYDKMRFITMHIGGGFGCKIINYAYVILIALAAMKVHRPVKWLETRTESLLAASHGAERIFDLAVPVKKDGTILGLKIHSIDDNGAYARHEPAGLTVWAQVTPGAYRIRHIESDMYAVFTNKCPAGPNRGFARAPHLFMIERVVDLVARELGLDPAQVRQKNYIRREDQPYTTPNGCVYDDGDYPKSLEIVLKALEYEKWRSRQAELRKQGRYIGLGLATTLDSGAPNFGQVKMLNPKLPLIGNSEAALLQITPDGRFIAKLGTVPQGQSHETTAAQVIAATFDVSPDTVSVSTGFDSASHPYTMHSGTYGSRFAALGVGAIYGAALKLKQKLLLLAAHLLQEPVERLEFRNGAVQVKEQPDRNLTIKRLARTAYGMPPLLPPGMEPGLWAINVYRPSFQAPDQNNIANLALTYSYQTHGVLVEVDAETGKTKILKYVIVDDAGTLINPLVVEGQVHGAALHGIAAALFEEYRYGVDGQLLTSTLVDYLTPFAVDVPDLEVHHLEIPSPFSVLGAKGVGEGGGTAHVAVINAVEDALQPLRVKLEKSIVTPEDVFEIISGGATIAP